MSDTDTTPVIQVPESPVMSQVAAIGRIASILVPGFGLILSFLKAKDVSGAWVWFHTTDGAQFGAALVTAATIGYSLWTTFAKHKQAVLLADAAPNSVAKVTK